MPATPLPTILLALSHWAADPTTGFYSCETGGIKTGHNWDVLGVVCTALSAIAQDDIDPALTLVCEGYIAEVGDQLDPYMDVVKYEGVRPDGFPIEDISPATRNGFKAAGSLTT